MRRGLLVFVDRALELVHAAAQDAEQRTLREGGPEEDIDEQRLAHLFDLWWGGEPVEQFMSAVLGDGIHLPIWPGLLYFQLHLHEPLALELFEGGVDLTQLRAPEVRHRRVEELLQLVPGHGAIVQEAEDYISNHNYI